MDTPIQDIDKLWDYNNPQETEEKFRDILDKMDDNQLDYKAELLTQIARTQGLQRKFDDAHKTLDKALKLIKPENHRINVRYLLERGRAFNSSGNSDKAIPLFWEAYKTALKNNLDFYAVDAAHMMGIVEKGEESLKWNSIAIRIAEASKDERSNGWLGSLYNNTGWTYHDMGKYEEALKIFKQNVLWHENRKSKMPLIIAKWCVARTLRSLKRVEEALKILMGLIEELKEKGLEQDGYVYEEIGECLLLKNKPDEAKAYFKSAYELLSKDIWLQANEKRRLDRIKILSS